MAEQSAQKRIFFRSKDVRCRCLTVANDEYLRG